jgi:hypothetical protein
VKAYVFTSKRDFGCLLNLRAESWSCRMSDEAPHVLACTRQKFSVSARETTEGNYKFEF